MKMKNKCLRLSLWIIGVSVCLVLFGALIGLNDLIRSKQCLQTLRAIASAIEVYRADHGGSLPPSLLEVKSCIQGTYIHGPNGVPICVGNRNEKEDGEYAQYIYDPVVSSERIRPICWDSKPHRMKLIILPDVLKWNVLYTDGHIETLNMR
jgi:hypothetical protein